MLLLFFIGGLIILPQKANADEVEAVPVSISVKYGQTEARTILDMINEARTNSEHAWYWNKDDTTKTFCTDLKELEYDYDLERVSMKRAAEMNVQLGDMPGTLMGKKILGTVMLVKISLPIKRQLPK